MDKKAQINFLIQKLAEDLQTRFDIPDIENAVYIINQVIDPLLTPMIQQNWEQLRQQADQLAGQWGAQPKYKQVKYPGGTTQKFGWS